MRQFLSTIYRVSLQITRIPYHVSQHITHYNLHDKHITKFKINDIVIWIAISVQLRILYNLVWCSCWDSINQVWLQWVVCLMDHRLYSTPLVWCTCEWYTNRLVYFIHGLVSKGAHYHHTCLLQHWRFYFGLGENNLQADWKVPLEIGLAALLQISSLLIIAS